VPRAQPLPVCRFELSIAKLQLRLYSELCESPTRVCFFAFRKPKEKRGPIPDHAYSSFRAL
jgi:hypothetical protein